MIEIPFSVLVFGYLAGLTKELALEMVADAAVSGLRESLSSRDVSALMEECLRDAVKNKSQLLNGSRKPVPGGSVREAYLDAAKLHQNLSEDPSIKPDVSLPIATNSWREYLKPFQEIIVIPGFNLSEAEYLDLIQVVLDESERLFDERVAHRHPAFEQVLLRYQKKHSEDHQQILREITTVSETVREISRTQEVKSMPSASVPSGAIDWSNPFSVVAADDLELSNPEHVRQIKNLFIARYTDLPTFKKRYNTILEGQRGTGKTMIMKYLAFETQMLEWTETKGQQHKDFLSGPDSFIGVYSKLGQGVYDKADFEAIAEQSRRERIFEHRLCLQLLFDVLETMKSVYQHFPPHADQFLRVKRNLNLLLKANGELEVCKNHSEMILSAQDHINFILVQEVDEYLGSVSPGGSQITDFNPSLTLTGQLLPFLKLLRQSCSTTAPFFLMLDDFDVLESYQQARVFKTASKREFSTACFKFGLMVLGRKSMLSGESRTFRSSDDYDRIDLDWTRGGLHDNYQTALVEIGNARLTAADPGWHSDLSTLLPDWQRGTEIFNEVKALMETEWEAFEEKPTGSKSDYVSKYGSARFFQTLRSKKTRMRYAGIENVTLVSSGIYRQFLEACKLIFDRAHDRNWAPENGGVSPEIQDDAIREYSEEMIQQFSRTSGDSQALLSGDIEVTSSHMITLIDSFCDVFYSRLHTPAGTLGEGEPEIICVAIRDDLKQCPEAEILLNIGVRESILHRFKYKPKTAGGPPLPAFMLNRRLGPRRDLSIRRMQGRIELDAPDIILAATDRKKFFDKIQGNKVNVDKANDGNGRSSSQLTLPSE